MTIYALSTPSGTSGISVIRISGPQTKKVLTSLIEGKFPSPRKATLKKIYGIDKEIIDEGMILWFPKPNSYTGEDIAEIHLHGSKAVINSMLFILSKNKDCRLAEPGEFTKLAFENGKINLIKVEAISDLISSETELQRKQAIKFLAGDVEKTYLELRSRLLKVLSNIEAQIDFPDEDLPEDILKNIKKETEEIVGKISKILNDNKVGEKIRDGFKIVIIGPPNSGKSSLLNYFSKREAAIVSEIEGTTRDIIEVNLNLDGYPVKILDSAGIRETANPIEKKGINLALKHAKNSDLKIILLDAKNPNFKGFFDDIYDDKCLVILNKSDLISGDLSKINLKIDDYSLISIKHNDGLDQILKKIKVFLKNNYFNENNILISRERHRYNLEKCLEQLKLFLEKKSANDFDKAAEDLRLATRYLGKIVGDVDVEEILGKIFNDFCIGK